MPSASVRSVSSGDSIARRSSRARALYLALLGERGPGPGRIDDITRTLARTFLRERLAEAASLPSELPLQRPADARALAAHLAEDGARVRADWAAYLAERRGGAPRRFFATRAHALHTLRALAPTKLVDGAWLYGLMARADDPRLAGLARTYLEELGDGRPSQNHVLLYRRLLQAHGLDAADADAGADDGLDDAHYEQGAIQLALGHHAEEFLPEIVGFNLGYEQLPLHLLVAAHELAELGIDPYYFTLHVTVDNAGTGHARKAIDSVFALMPRLGDADAFWRRVVDGARLNALGLGTTDVIAAFDADREVLRVLGKKALVGANLHADRCRIGGRTVNDWLGEPAALPAFLRALESHGWIRRGQDPARSRFWALVVGDAAPMEGVFEPWELELLRDWIAGPERAAAVPVRPARARPAADPAADAGAEAPAGASTAEAIRAHLDAAGVGDGGGPGAAGADADLHALARHLAGVTDRDEALAALHGLLSPANHPTPAGLLATRIVSDLLRRAP